KRVALFHHLPDLLRLLEVVNGCLGLEPGGSVQLLSVEAIDHPHQDPVPGHLHRILQSEEHHSLSPQPVVDRREYGQDRLAHRLGGDSDADRKSTRLNSSHVKISYAVFCLKKKNGLFPSTHAQSIATYTSPRRYQTASTNSSLTLQYHQRELLSPRSSRLRSSKSLVATLRR